MLKSIRGGFIALIFLFISLSYSNIFVAVKFLYYDEPIPLFSVLNVDDSVANDVIVKLVFTISPIKNATKEIRLSVAPSLIHRHKDCTDCCFMHFDGCKYRDVNHTTDCIHTSDLIWYNVFDYDVNLFGGRSAFNCVIKKINLEFLSGKTQEISGAQIIRLGDPWKI